MYTIALSNPGGLNRIINVIGNLIKLFVSFYLKLEHTLNSDRFIKIKNPSDKLVFFQSKTTCTF